MLLCREIPDEFSENSKNQQKTLQRSSTNSKKDNFSKNYWKVLSKFSETFDFTT